MNTLRRAVKTTATGLLLAAGAVALAAPAHADVHVDPLGGVADIDINGALEVGVLEEGNVVSVPNPVSGVL
ncbi:hypothetical protein ACF06X_32960 [Streptomyces sp. NPDC015346]|uniref:hypothetical protein n=1 Tax=Streptomyces sp. NPDC015346 TaxID=3364954 RepID=UPI003702F94E